MEIFESDDKITFDITKTIDASELAERWGVTKKSIDNRRQRGQGPNYFKIGGKIRYDLKDVVRMEQESYRSINGSRITKS